MYAGSCFLGIIWPIREVDNSPPSMAEFKNEWCCISSAHTSPCLVQAEWYIYLYFLAFNLQKIDQFVWDNHSITHKGSWQLKILLPTVVQSQYLITEKMLQKMPKIYKAKFPITDLDKPLRQSAHFCGRLPVLHCTWYSFLLEAQLTPES